MKTSIFLKSLAITTKIGINPDEKITPQTIFIDLALQYKQEQQHSDNVMRSRKTQDVKYNKFQTSQIEQKKLMQRQVVVEDKQ